MPVIASRTGYTTHTWHRNAVCGYIISQPSSRGPSSVGWRYVAVSCFVIS